MKTKMLHNPGIELMATSVIGESVAAAPDLHLVK